MCQLGDELTGEQNTGDAKGTPKQGDQEHPLWFC
jgi:hypothetical protein